MVEPHALLNILLLSLVAGLGTGVGGLIAILRKPGLRFFGFLMGVTAGVMITLAFLQLVNEAWELAGWWTATVGFCLGAMAMFTIDFFIPHIRFGQRESVVSDLNPQHEIHQHRRWMHFSQRGVRRSRLRYRIHDPKLFKSGALIAIGITIHNIPEGIAIGAGYMLAPKFGFFIALAILLHNIPEGIATALPLCKSGLARFRSFLAALFSGLAEPIGALAAALFLCAYQDLIPGALAFAGGVMVIITLDELIPTAREYGHEQFTAMRIILGSAFVFVLSGVLGV